MSEKLWEELVVYLQLAQAFQRRKRMADRDRALILAGCCAQLCGQKCIANYCRCAILQNNRGHMIGKWPDFEAALDQIDFQALLKQLTRRLSREQAESQMQELGFSTTLNRDDFGDDFSFLAALVEKDPDWLEEQFG